MSEQTRKIIDVGTALYPLPAVLVSSGNGSETNLMTAAWVGVMSSKPPVIGVGIRPERHSYDLMKSTGEFGINVPDRTLVPALVHCGRVSGRDSDKFADLEFTPVRPHALDHAPVVGQCPLSLECRVMNIVPLGSHDLFLGEVVAVWADDRILSPDGRLDPSLLDMIAFASGRYLTMGEEVIPGDPPSRE